MNAADKDALRIILKQWKRTRLTMLDRQELSELLAGTEHAGDMPDTINSLLREGYLLKISDERLALTVKALDLWLELR